MQILIVFAVAAVVGLRGGADAVDTECIGIRDGSTFRDRQDCAKHYACESGNFKTYQCPLGLNWDQVYQVCQLPAFVICKYGPFITPTTTTSMTIAPTWAPTEPPATSAPLPPPPAETEIVDGESLEAYDCPKVGVTSLPHKESCSKYVICFDGTGIFQSCAPGLHFDSKTGQCTFPIYAKCELQEQICPKAIDQHTLIFIPDKFDCSKYYHCFNGETHENSCAQGLHWDPINNYCVPAYKSGCISSRPYSSQSYKPILTSKSSYGCMDESAHWSEHPQSCRFYYLCYKGKATLKQCDQGLVWDNVRGSCNYQSVSSCRK